MLDESLREHPNKNPIILDNITCVYCGTSFDSHPSTKEHVISRAFVPKGSFDRQWNLIVRACKECNQLKAGLEDDISAITMQPNSAGQFATADGILRSEAERKGKRSISRVTGKQVGKSASKITINTQIMPGVNATFNFTGEPEISTERVHELAKLQTMAFFYFLTFDVTSRSGRFWRGQFASIMHSQRSDWGNAVNMKFMQSTLDWEPRMLAITAGEYFKVVIRRHPSSLCWSWGLEWNQNHRIVGYFGDIATIEDETKSLPELIANAVPHDGEGHLAVRSEVPIAADADVLFAVRNS